MVRAFLSSAEWTVWTEISKFRVLFAMKWFWNRIPSFFTAREWLGTEF
jgi:hypothetical protein